MSKPFVSILIDTHNHERFIEEAIASVLEQDFPAGDCEILAVDDGSSDRTSEIIHRFEPRVRLLRKTNASQASALNFGIAKARGEIIALPTVDDFFLPDKLASVAEAFQRNPALGMVYHPLLGRNMQTNERREFKFPLISGNTHTAPDLFSFNFSHPTSCVSFRRTILNRLLPILEGIRMLGDECLINLIPYPFARPRRPRIFRRLPHPREKSLLRRRTTNAPGGQKKQIMEVANPG